MKIIIGDIHLNDVARDAYRHEFMARILPETLRKNRAEGLIILGDLTDEKDRHSAWLVNKLVEHITAITNICWVIIEKGNHDYIVADNPFFEFLRRIPKVHWIGRPTPASKIAVPGLPKRTIFLPHTVDHVRDWEGIELDDYDLVFAHQTFKGAVGESGHKLDGIDPKIFGPDALVVSGDIHVPQEFDNVIYCGSPYTIDFGDSFAPRMLTLEGDTIDGIPCPGPQKRLLEISSLKELKQQRMLNEGDLVKVRVKLAPADHARWPEMRQEVKDWGERNGFNIYLVQPKVQPTAPKERRAAKASSDKQLMEQYANGRDVNSTTLSTGLSLMRKV